SRAFLRWPALMPENEISPPMAGRPKAGRFRPKMSRPGRTGSSRTIGAAYTGAVCFRQSGRSPHLRLFGALRNRTVGANISGFAVFLSGEDGGSSRCALNANLVAEPIDISDP